jgi:UDP-N-acetylmuramoyl-L-alanyl-D-glutamate--2,6-diaminopimelate ligase
MLDDEELPLPKDYHGFLALMRACLDRGGKLAAIELTSEALARGFMRAWPSEVGVFTNLTHDHLDAHGSWEHYLASKAQLFLNLPEGGTAVLNGCDPAAALIAEIVPKHVRTWRYGVPARGDAWGELDARATGVDLGWDGTRVALAATLPALPREIRVRAIGAIYAENALAALLGAVALGVDAGRAAEAIASVPAPPGRFEVVHERPYVVVDYAHSPDALLRTVATGRKLATQRLTVVFGAGGRRDKAKRAPMGEAAHDADRVILTTDNPRDEDPAAIAAAVARGLAGHPNVETILDRAEAITRAIHGAGPDDVILIAGKGHETEQTIGEETHAFSDRDVARSALYAR